MTFLNQLFPLSPQDDYLTGPVKGSRPWTKKSAGLYNYVAFALNLLSFFTSVLKQSIYIDVVNYIYTMLSRKN
jgi:hypothetical protein